MQTGYNKYRDTQIHTCEHRIQCHVYQMSLVKSSFSPGELQDTDMPLHILHYHHEHSVSPDCRFWPWQGRCLAPEAPVIDNSDQARWRNGPGSGPAQLSPYPSIASLFQQNKIRHFIGSSISSIFRIRELPHFSAEILQTDLLQGGFSSGLLFMKQSPPAERLHGKPYTTSCRHLWWSNVPSVSNHSWRSGVG